MTEKDNSKTAQDVMDVWSMCFNPDKLNVIDTNKQIKHTSVMTTSTHMGNDLTRS